MADPQEPDFVGALNLFYLDTMVIEFAYNVAEQEAATVAVAYRQALNKWIAPLVTSKIDKFFTLDGKVEFLVLMYHRTPFEMLKRILSYRQMRRKYREDAAGFFLQLQGVLARKKCGLTALESTPLWARRCLYNWLRINDLTIGLSAPPMCLWSDSAIRSVFHLEGQSDANIRKVIERLGLKRPSRPRFGVEKGAKNSTGWRWVKRAGGAVTKRTK